jgi:hypothetical protein
MDTNGTLKADLQTLEKKWVQITDVPESPRSLMNVIEYSLGSQKKAEVYVNRLLAYFLDPEKPHGMDAEFLRAALDGLPAKCEFQEDVHDLSDVVVDDQVRVSKVVDNTIKSSGIVDLLIEVSNEWFLMIELKFSAKDTQTEFYYREATNVGGESKADYESGTYYLYLHQHDQPTANEPNFTNWTWKAFSTDVLEPFILENAARYPQRTVAQLREFNDDIRSISGMTEQQENEQEKIALYLDHYDAIKDVSDTFDSHWGDFTDEWGNRLGETLEQDGFASHSDFNEDLTAVELQSETGGRGGWKFRTNSSDWGMIFKDGWWRHTDALDREIYARPDDRDDVRIGFHHRLEKNRNLAVEERTLKIYFRNMGANDQEFINAFVDVFAERKSEVADLLPSSAELTGNKRNMVVATYDIEAESHEDFFEAYVRALKKSFVDLVVDNEQLISVIDDIYSASIEDVYGVSIQPGDE